MTDQLIERLRASDPAALTDDDVAARDAAIWESLSMPTASKAPGRAGSVLKLALSAALVAGVILAVGLARSGDRGSGFSAAAKTYRALDPKNRIYHFVSVSRLTEEPKGVAQSYSSPFQFPLVGESHSGRPLYQEVWLTPNAERVRWLAFKGPGGERSGVAKAFAFRQSPDSMVYGAPPRQKLRPGCQPQGQPTDPAAAFRSAYCYRRIVSKGTVRLGNRSAWRFVSRPSEHGSQQEWLVDPATQLPVRYSYVDHNQQAGVPYTARLVVRFLKFEVIPLGPASRRLLHLSPSERAVCEALDRAELARARKHLTPARYESAVRQMRHHHNCV